MSVVEAYAPTTIASGEATMPSRREVAKLRKTTGYRKARAQLLARSTTCWICGRDGADTADHVVPLIEGGHPTSLLNMRPAHQRCNSSRGANRSTVTDVQTSRPW